MASPGNVIVIDEPRGGFFYRTTRKITASRLGIWLFSPSLHVLDRITLALSKGKATLAGILGGVAIVTIATAGRRRGRPRTVPLLGIPAGDAIILIASNWGRPRNPTWYASLKADPHIAVTYRRRTEMYVARELEGTERDAHWRTAADIYPGYEVYQRRCPSRKIPVIMLSPSPT